MAPRAVRAQAPDLNLWTLVPRSWSLWTTPSGCATAWLGFRAMAQYAADPQAIRGMAKGFLAVRGTVLDADRIAEQSRSAIGSGEVADALHDVLTNWSTKRDEIAGHLKAVAAAADAAGHAYGAVEHAFVTAFGDGR